MFLTQITKDGKTTIGVNTDNIEQYGPYKSEITGNVGQSVTAVRFVSGALIEVSETVFEIEAKIVKEKA